VGQQRLHGHINRADLDVIELARPKMHALAHHHAHQQRLGRLRQLGELRHEALLLFVQHIGIALAQPVEHLPEVMQVVERVFEGIGHDGHLDKHWLCIQSAVPRLALQWLIDQWRTQLFA